MALILIVDDDRQLREMVEMLLTDEGHEVKTADSVFHARGVLAKIRPDLLVLDRSLPDADGLKILEEVRAERGYDAIPVLFLTGNDRPKQRAQALDHGADDYMGKPFSHDEFLARVRALLRRAQPAAERATALKSGELVLDRERHEVLLKGKHVPLPRREFELLAAFLESPGRVLERRFLLERVWGSGAELTMNSKTVDVAMGRLRSALGSWGKKLETVQNYGYRLNAGG